MDCLGPGRYVRRWTKPQVEGCRFVLHAERLQRLGYFDPDAPGVVRWVDSVTGREVGSAGYAITGRGRSFRLDYSVGGEPVGCEIRLLETRPRLGGVRRWFACPMARDGALCGRRVGRLYLLGGGFGCRRCHDLRYQSVQEAHKTERLIRRLGRRRGYGPEDARRMAAEFHADVRLRDRLRRE